MSNDAAPSVSFTVNDFQNPGIRRLCDVVMKGGITSGVVYPLAICRLATAYVIKHIGGTSVGAIAAAITAAAEYRRRNGSGQGYIELAKLPDFLGRTGTLLALFAADRQARTLLKLALIPIGHASFIAKATRLIFELLVRYFWIPLLNTGVIFGFIVAAASLPTSQTFWRYLLVAAIVGFFAALIFISIWVAYQMVVVLNRNNFGWCHGYSREWDAKTASCRDVTALDAKDVPPLFNWLAAFIAQTAGRGMEEPLTFGDLWSAKDPAWHDSARGERGIEFGMVSTCLTLSRPFHLPFDPNDPISQAPDPATDFDDDGNRRPSIYFRKEDLAAYFSEAIVEHMVRFGKQTGLVTSGAYYRFPAAENVPIIVATRMSMSFPVLFCAVPLYACDVTGHMQRIWFSDGGITSNFPIQFFDSPLPRWPTFGIDLLSAAPSTVENGTKRARFSSESHLQKYASGAVFIESEAPRGSVSPWDRIDCGGALSNVLAFASSILDAARTWQDVTLASLPGNASRIVGIRLSEDQGGINLTMPSATIDAMTRLGSEAGSKLVDVFATGEPEPPGWKTHRWIRYRATMGAITRWIDGFACGYAPFRELPQQQPYSALITDELPIERQADVAAATGQVAAVPIVETFYQIEEEPIAVLPMRPVV